MKISLIKSKSIKATNVVYVVKNIKDIDSSILSKEELKFVSEQFKKKSNLVSLSGLGELRCVLRVSDKNSGKDREQNRVLGSEICALANKLKSTKITLVNLFTNSTPVLDVAESIALSNYQFLKYFSDKDKKKNSLKELSIFGKGIKENNLTELKAVITATNEARTLVNEPLSFLTATQISEEMKRLSKDAGIKIEVFNQSKIETLKMGGLLAVNKGSLDPATFSIMEWKPKNAGNKKPYVLVGKGVVYDTGGLSLKPTPNSMDIMKCDMGGAAAMIGAIYAIAKANLPVHIIALIPATDNRPGGNAYAPGDVIKMYDGTNVEVLNTDAEGRMIMADALAYAKKYNPELVIDAATLTGAAVRAIGTHASVVMGNASKKEMSELMKSGENVHERLVEFPFWDDYGKEIKSSIADIKNLGGGAGGGMIHAGKFLEHFTDYPYIHIDIAGPAWLDKNEAYRSKGGTGTGVRTLFNFFKNKCK